LAAIGGAAEESSGARDAPLIAKGCIVERRHSGERKEIIIQPSYNYGDSDQMIPPRGMSKKQAASLCRLRDAIGVQ